MISVVRAAAGCGKTTALAARYLAFLRDGVEVDRAIAITFTRRAAAELQERVSLALRAAGDGPGAEQARQRLGAAWPVYAEAAPTDPAVIRAALEGLPDAPIGTTDAFVQRLLTEHALDAALPLPNADAVPLDVPIGPGRGAGRALDRAARRLLDPPGGDIDPEVRPLLEHLTLDELRACIVRRSPVDDLPPARATEVLAELAHELARVLARHDLAAAYQVPDATDEASWAAILDKRTNVSGRWAVPAVARWLAHGGEPPYELAGWLVGLETRSKARKAIQADLQAAEHDFGIGRLSLWDVVSALEYPYDQVGHVEVADGLRLGIHRLRQRVAGEALEAAALAGDLGYDELLEAAIALCQDPPASLRERFRALLVDEVQDANPAQLRLYRAIAALPGGVSAWFVGDARQSIYLFRHAEPQGLADLEALSTSDPQDLLCNFRSAPLLVQAHRALFAAVDDPMRRRRWNPPAALDTLSWREENAALALDSEPVWIVQGDELDQREADRRALHAFLGRVRAAWEAPGGAHDTAVVLVGTWRAARDACQQLRRWAGRDDVAWVDGSTGWTTGRVGTDISLHLRALADPSDDVAWLGVLKHPAVGLSDAALARIRAGQGLYVRGEDGLEPGAWTRPKLGWILGADVLGAPHDERDVLAFERARNALRAARASLGRLGTAEVLDTLVTALHWRTVLAAGPGGTDDVAQLEVLLDWIRTLDDDGMAPDAVVALLGDAETEAPHVHLVRPGQHITCTTIYQAKGLAWDHVCVLSPGRVPRIPTDEPAWMDTAAGRVRLEGVKFDPYGGITAFDDPLGRLAKRLHQHRRAEESARLAYVAITRARRSVTLGLPTKAVRNAVETDVSTILRDAWLAEDFGGPGIARVEVPAPPEDLLPPTGWAAPDPAVARLQPVPVPPPGREERAPSSMGAHLDGPARLHLAEGVVARVRLANGLHLGGAAVAPADERLLHPSEWGDIAHGWLARWGFRGPVQRAAIEGWLVEAWGGSEPSVVDWLVGVCAGLDRAGGPLWQHVTAPGARLHFELPFVGVGTQVERDVLLSGRMDLCIEHPGGRLWVVDFKAGEKLPTGWHDLVDGASLRTYAPQLEAYSQALRRMGKKVDAVALWFVRTGTSVMWTP